MANDDGGKFKSFKDLARARGVEPEKEPEPEGRGWTVETDDGEDRELTEEELAALPDPDRSIRARSERRPPANGPMETGPPCYRDEESDELELLRSFRMRLTFPEDVEAEVGALPEDPDEADFAGRWDLRDRTIFTIDGDDAKDYDDAISIEDLGEGRLEVGVHIADVSHYVCPGTALDEEAVARATSVYLPDQVVPMLPEELSNRLCSLVPDRPRLAYSVFMTFEADGSRSEARVGKSVIQSVMR